MRCTGQPHPGGLAPAASVRRHREWMYVFSPSLAGVILYVKVIVRDDCIVVSFHEDEPK